MDSKLLQDSRLADLALKTQLICAAVKDIPGAAISSDNVTLDLTKFHADGAAAATVVLARIGAELATVTVLSNTATLDFTTAATTASILEVYVALDI